jgi:hypothetical protein
MSKGDDTKAKDLLRGGMAERKTLGAGLLERVGRRAKSGPGSARRSKLFARLGLADPYDASAKERPLSIGPVALKLGQKRRVAPHLAVKDPQKKKRQAAQDPVAQWRPKGVPNAKAKPAPRPKAAPPKAASMFDRPPQKNQAAEATVEEQPRPSLGLPPKEKQGTGRFRMRRTSSSGPKIRPVTPKPQPSRPAAESAPPKPAEPVNRSAPRGDLGLDDLFGMGGSEGRMRIPGRNKKK